MLSAAQIAELAAALGTPVGLAQVNDTIKELSHYLMDPQQNFSRAELTEILRALNALSAAILCMDQATRALLGQTGAGTVNCVG